MKKRLLATLLPLLLAAAGCASSRTGLPPGAAVVRPGAAPAPVPLLNAAQKSYLSKPLAERRVLFRDPAFRSNLVETAGSKPLPVRIDWSGTAVARATRRGAPTVFSLFESDGAEAGTNATLVLFFSPKRDEARVDLTNLKIGQRYVWRACATPTNVLLALEQASGSFRTEDAAPRLLDLGGVPNARDIGGRVGLGGRRVKQNMLLRSGGLNENATPREEPDTPGPSRVTDRTRAALVVPLPGLPLAEPTRDGGPQPVPIALHADLDVRTDKECFGMEGSPLGPSAAWLHHSVSLYQWLVDDEGGAASFRTLFPLLLDERNYPMLTHCIEGQDRTGSICFLLEGLLGVDEEEMWRDWEATGFHNPKWGFRHESRMDPFLRALDKFEGATLHEKIESYCLAIGIPKEQIEAFRERLLEPAP